MNYFTCPLTKCLFQDPVVASDGYTYEKEAIEKWFESGNTKSPVTLEDLENKDLIGNMTLKSINMEETIKREEELDHLRFEKKSEILHKRLKEKSEEELPTQAILEALLKGQEALHCFKTGLINVSKCIDTLSTIVSEIEDEELLIELILLLLYRNDWELSSKYLDMLEQNPHESACGEYLRVYWLCMSNPENIEKALAFYQQLETSRGENVFKVKEIKYKGIALIGLAQFNKGVEFITIYQTMVTYDPSVYVLFKLTAMIKIELYIEVVRFCNQYFIKYGMLMEINKFKFQACKALGMEEEALEIQKLMQIE